jgi:hypothetical protein
MRASGSLGMPAPEEKEVAPALRRPGRVISDRSVTCAAKQTGDKEDVKGCGVDPKGPKRVPAAREAAAAQRGS